LFYNNNVKTNFKEGKLYENFHRKWPYHLVK